MGATLGELLPLIVGIAISPIPIIAVILMLFSKRAKTNGPAFLLGWLGGIVVLAGIVYTAADAGDVATKDTPSHTASVVTLLLGVVLLGAARRRWAKRPGPGEEAEMPKWMAGVEDFTAGKSFVLGAVLGGVNPKNLALVAAAAIAIAQANLGTTDSWITIAIFAVLASVTVGGAVLADLIAGDRARRVLDTWKTWLTANNAAVMAVLFVVFGAVLIGKGVQQLAA
jgi:hypothetical protein